MVIDLSSSSPAFDKRRSISGCAPVQVPGRGGAQSGADEPVPGTDAGVYPVAEALRTGVLARPGPAQRSDADCGGAGQPVCGPEAVEELPRDLEGGRATRQNAVPSATR